MAIVDQYRKNYGVAVIGIGAFIRVSGRMKSGSAVVGHVLRFHREGRGWGVICAECVHEVKVCFEEWVET